ncbi:MAG: mismatch repair protein MutS [Verrucomicrobiales bacterium]|nr:mismatch repair protein MutS [Verrucomicrobiales bacterium]
MAAETQLTPMMSQYRRIKGELPGDAVLLFRLGDFYEMFFEDAQVSAQILNVTLTRRGLVPMCGIPYHAAPGYIAKLLKAGRKVAICDQTEEARPGQLVKREVTQILSPGTHFDERLLTAEANNYVAAIYAMGKLFGLALVDLTTGDFKVTELEGEVAIRAELERARPAEIVYPAESHLLKTLLQSIGGIASSYDDWVFAPETALYTLRDHFKVASLDGFGLRNKNAATGAAGGLVHYLSQHLRRNISHLSRLTCYQCSDFLTIDSTTLRNLEILESSHKDSIHATSLFGVLNRTVTPMGARRLRDWLSQPCGSIAPIHARQEAVAQWVAHPQLLKSFRDFLREVRDLERITGRITFGSANGRDLQALRNALDQLPALQEALKELLSNNQNFTSSLLQENASAENRPPELLLELLAELRTYPEISDLIARSIIAEPPLTIREGGVIQEGFDQSLDELRNASRDGKTWIAKLQQEEIEKTGITSLKIRFNSVFGYFIEVTKSNLDRVPSHYTRKQTVANGERYITPDLKEVEGKILGAEERSVKLEYEIFQRVRESILGQMPAIQRTAIALSNLDVLSSFGETALLFNYCRPVVGTDGVLKIVDGRHPVLDQAVSENRFVPNDVELDLLSRQIALITGPNMAGKSTYIRQVALLALLAHTGSYLPAREARVDLLDRIFTRIGASDDLSRGQSTFMVEMSETANILNNATQRSLVILDEIGRGTSTFDGLSLAWSIVEHLHHQVGAKTLFATHYHELTELAGRLPRIKNFNVAVREWNDQIVFLRKIVEGGTDKSYGIQVARLAGVPKTVLERAKEILRNLEDSELTPEGKTKYSSRQKAEREKLKSLAPAPQLDLFS